MRAGLLSAAESGNVDLHGVAAVAALAGMFSKQATDKLDEIFSTMFRTTNKTGDSQRSHKLDDQAPRVATVAPPALAVGGASPQLVIGGANLSEDAVVMVNDAARPTRFDNGKLVVELTKDDVAHASRGRSIGNSRSVHQFVTEGTRVLPDRRAMARHAPCHLHASDRSMSDPNVQGPKCPSCGASVASVASVCWTCGHELAVNETSQATQAVEQDQIPLVEWKSSDAPAPESMPPTAQARAAVPATQGRSWSLALIGGAGVAACVLAMVVVQSLRPVASEQPIEAVRPATPAPVATAPAVDLAPAPTWVGSRQATWANDGSKTVSFELKASSDVTVWMARVRPLLVVRCLYRTTEVFVAIKSAASIEGQAGNHTVRLQIDDDPELVQQWSDSVTGQELFAPASVEIVRRLARAERLHFSFTPYNAKPVTAEFSVQGFEKLAALVSGTCGWKLDDSRS